MDVHVQLKTPLIAKHPFYTNIPINKSYIDRSQQIQKFRVVVVYMHAIEIYLKYNLFKGLYHTHISVYLGFCVFQIQKVVFMISIILSIKPMSSQNVLLKKLIFDKQTFGNLVEPGIPISQHRP